MSEALRTTRAAARLVALCLLTATLYAVWVLSKALLCVSKRARTRWRGLLFRLWGRAAAGVIGMRLDARGVAPRPPFLLVVNHLGYADVVARVPGTVARNTDVADGEVSVHVVEPPDEHGRRHALHDVVANQEPRASAVVALDAGLRRLEGLRRPAEIERW
jgi:hypothetical protein